MIIDDPHTIHTRLKEQVYRPGGPVLEPHLDKVPDFYPTWLATKLIEHGVRKMLIIYRPFLV